jgi:diguanylate cyclase (GGDEF)-like protein
MLQGVAFDQIGLMLFQAALLAVSLILLFRMRFRFGISFLYISLGVLQYLHAQLALSVYVQVAPGIVVSPGSVVIFAGSFFIILLVYIREDALEARKICYGILAASVITTVLAFLFGVAMRLPSARILSALPQAFFQQSARLTIVSIAALTVDVLLIIIVYEALGRWLRRLPFLRTFLSLTMVLAVDTVLFVTGSFVESPEYGLFLTSGLIGKSVASLFYSAILSLYLRFFEREAVPLPGAHGVRDVFLALTFREKFRLMQEVARHDALTGIYNRGFFNEILPRELSLAARLGLPLSLIMADIDKFKEVNDEHGHRAGDTVLKELAQLLTACTRTSDFLCRFGGEEFVLLLPNTDGPAARQVAEKIAATLRQQQLAERVQGWTPRITLTMGLATFPGEADGPDALLEKADARLFVGKENGRNRIVGGS